MSGKLTKLSIIAVLFFGVYHYASASFTVSRSPTLTTGLVGYWTFDGADTNFTTNTVADKSGNGNAGAMTNMSTSTACAPGKIGQALKFDGVNDYVDVGNAASLDITDTITIGAWFKTNTLSFPNNHRMIFAGGDSASYLSLAGSNLASPFLSLRIGGIQRTLNSNFYPSINTWYHVVATWDGDKERIYVNGTLRDTSISYSRVLNTSGTKYIGRYNDNGYEFNGLIDEVRVYNRALSASEVKTLYNMGR